MSVISNLKPGRELTRVFDKCLLERYYNTCKQGCRHNLSNGDPLSTPFPPIPNAVAQTMSLGEMALYTRGGGPKRFRDKMLPYFESMGISPNSKTLSHQNVTFGIGSTYLYSVLLRVLEERGQKAHPNKQPVLLMPAPTYGIFTMQPENRGFDIETFDLSPDDDWQINPDVLDARIKEINAEKNRYVCALYHANPHNPTGTVANAEQTLKTMRVLKAHDVFAIDDMAYAGIEHKSKAAPLAMHDFDNSATLMTLSKAYCMPRARSGIICAPEWIVEGIDAHTDMNMISIPASVFAAAAACFDDENRYLRENGYLPKNSATYQEHYDVMKAVVDGIEHVEGLDNKRHDEIKTLVQQTCGSRKQAQRLLSEGLPQLEILNDTPEAGYFAIVRIKNLDGMFYGTTRLSNSFEFATAAIDLGHVLTLPLNFALAGHNLGDSLRLSFGGMNERTIVKALKGLDSAIRSLPPNPDIAKQKHLEKRGLLLSCQ